MLFTKIFENFIKSNVVTSIFALCLLCKSRQSPIIVIVVAAAVICCLVWAALLCISQIKLRRQWASAMQMKNGLIVSIAIGEYMAQPENAEITGFLNNLPVQSDVENLNNFADFLNYQFLTVDNKYSWTKDEVMNFLENDVCDQFFDDDGNVRFDGLIVSISSHGIDGCILSSDYKKVDRTRIHRCISEKYPELREIPRIFLFDACDGTRDRRDSESFENEEKVDSAKNTEETKDDEETSTVEALQVESRDTEWSSKYKNPDYNLVTVNGSNDDYVSKIQHSTVGSYLTYFFTKAVRLNIEMKQRKGLGAILKDIQNLLHDEGKQLIKKTFFNETETLRIEKKQIETE